MKIIILTRIFVTVPGGVIEDTFCRDVSHWRDAKYIIFILLSFNSRIM